MTITLTREEAQQVLDALYRFVEYDYQGSPLDGKDIEGHEAIELLRARLAQPEPEPVAWHEPEAYGNVTVYKKWAEENGWLPLYTAPLQKNA